MFYDNGDGTYNISFVQPGVVFVEEPGSSDIGEILITSLTPYKTVKVDADLPTEVSLDGPVHGPKSYARLVYGHSTDISNSGKQELWVSLLEKAYALRFGGKAYAGIENGNVGLPMTRILGKNVTQHYISGPIGTIGGWSEEKLFDTIKNAIDQRLPLAISTKTGATPITDSHVFVPLAVDSAKREVTLYNPHDTIETYSISYLKQNCDNLWVAQK